MSTVAGRARMHKEQAVVTGAEPDHNWGRTKGSTGSLRAGSHVGVLAAIPERLFACVADTSGL